MIALSLITLLASCGNDSSTTDYQDGSYSAVYDAADHNGWKPFLNLTIKDGKIASADFDYVNQVGELKSQDQNYADMMVKITKKETTPASAKSAMEEQLIKKQAGPVDGVSGATSTKANFNELLSAILKNAEAGNTENIVIPMNDTYTVSDEADERGYTGTISVTYQNGEISKVAYDEVDADKVGKLGNESYNSMMKEHSGVSWEEAQAQLIKQLETTGSVDTVDAVSGATSLSERFKALAAKAISARG